HYYTLLLFFFSNDTATTEIFTLSLHDALPILSGFNVYPNEIEDVIAAMPEVLEVAAVGVPDEKSGEAVKVVVVKKVASLTAEMRSEEHTSELQSRGHLVCRLLLEKKKKKKECK